MFLSNKIGATTALTIILCTSLSNIQYSHSFAFSNVNDRISSTALFAKKKVFIDGEAGTTGLQVRERLADREDLEIISPPSELRKDEETRKKYINEADAVILCKFTSAHKDLCREIVFIEIYLLCTEIHLNYSLSERNSRHSFLIWIFLRYTFSML
mmetsp:Transcript_11317/g.16673  ORF Transcript_11317/g.16673 Transcript_11317/m.16673 type:complete len:156 (-) Transcript_11317:1073-1540(-)